MLKLVVLIVIADICLVQAFPQNPQSADATATIVSNSFADDGAGNFNFAFETSNGIKEQASGQLKDITVPTYDEQGQKTGEQSGKGEVQQGSFSYISPDGTPIHGMFDIFS